MKAVIMAGGEGTRLRPLTCDLPKPMARLCGRPVMTYLAKISFGVYFIHILIMSLLEWNMNFDGWARSLKLLFLEGVSVGGSILLIALFSGIPFCRRRIFGIKG